MSFDISITESSIKKLLKRFAINASSPSFVQAGNLLGENYLRFIDEQFQTEGSYFGGWADLAESTKKGKRKSKDLHGDPMQILVLTGRMRNSWSYNVTSNGVEIFNNMKSDSGAPYPAFHQFGIPQNNLPARPMLDLEKIPPSVLQNYLIDVARLLKKAL